MNNNVFLSNVASVVKRVRKMTDRVSTYLLLNCLQWCLRLSAEGSGVTVEGSASFTEEADTTPVADTKVAIDEDDDCGVDLFGEETEEEKKAAEGHAVAVKASGKKKEFGNSLVLN
ncbi:hypothetical protein HanRHA438_Chr09g0415001 [Helianthus annuus]|nr:hypothetical protein HanHA300_Chr09g0330921 [Helianthus annuus]KAJ0543547.1 hypothetical protein HanHA89_Chr09g0351891 [Helianthus annuus]KAJ0708600.1 hypothetical protein HanLR1_Chr09g0331191 [Helianthus annuus]KAJ0889632.1 hypothetical protein HanRHA438_Chr09g0415001 [Helianthus annuus]